MEASRRAVRTGRAAAILAAVLLLAACGDAPLYSNLDEREVNEIVAVLGRAGLPATKSGDGTNGFSVSTSTGAFPDAVAVLERNGLPRERYETIGDVFANEGFVSSPLEERARLNFALSQEISHTISSIDGVVVARVHLAVPQRADLGEEIGPASASVFVKHRRSVDLTGDVTAIKALVVNGMENLSYDDVTVALFPTDANEEPVREAAPPTVVADSGGGAQLAAVVPFAGPLAAIAIALAGGFCIWVGWFRGRADGRRRAAADDSARDVTVAMDRKGAER